MRAAVAAVCLAFVSTTAAVAGPRLPTDGLVNCIGGQITVRPQPEYGLVFFFRYLTDQKVGAFESPAEAAVLIRKLNAVGIDLRTSSYLTNRIRIDPEQTFAPIPDLLDKSSYLELPFRNAAVTKRQVNLLVRHELRDD